MKETRRALGLLGPLPARRSGLSSDRVEAQTSPAPSDMAHTKHNLSVSGPGPIRALTETRICVFCHTPHNAAPLSPLWNKALDPQAYTVYASPTLKAGPLAQPSGPTKLCLSCHDGTIAMGAVLNPVGGVAMAGGGLLAVRESLQFRPRPVRASPGLVSVPRCAAERRTGVVAATRPRVRRQRRGALHHVPRSAQGHVRQVPAEGQPLLRALHHAVTR